MFPFGNIRFQLKLRKHAGGLLSPLLFVLYIGEIVDMLTEAGCTGIYIDPEAPNIMILLFADDIALCSDTVGRLQKMINILGTYTEKWQMKLNLSKSKILVFRRGGKLRADEKFFYLGKEIEIVSEYKYLGIIFSAKLNWSKATKTLASQANKAAAVLNIAGRKCGGLPKDVALELFDKMLLPIVLYGAEIWGFKEWDAIERIQLKFLKRMLGVSTSASNAAVYAETGRYPLSVKYFGRCIKYWLNVRQMDNSRYPKRCYNYLKQLSDAGRISWASELKKLLCKYGFDELWESPIAEVWIISYHCLKTGSKMNT